MVVTSPIRWGSHIFNVKVKPAFTTNIIVAAAIMRNCVRYLNTDKDEVKRLVVNERYRMHFANIRYNEEGEIEQLP